MNYLKKKGKSIIITKKQKQKQRERGLQRETEVSQALLDEFQPITLIRWKVG